MNNINILVHLRISTDLFIHVNRTLHKTINIPLWNNSRQMLKLDTDQIVSINIHVVIKETLTEHHI